MSSIDFPSEAAANSPFMLHQYLLKEFERRSLSNPKYSMRAFARDLEIHSGTLSSILNQRRAVGAKVLTHIMQKLPLSAMEKKKILSEMMAPAATTDTDAPVLIDEKVLAIIQDWEHYAIMSYLQLRKVKKAPEDIAQAFSLPLSKIQRALANLEKAELIKHEGGKYKVMYKTLTTTRGIPSAALREAHIQYIDKAKAALTEFTTDERDITGRTMAISSKNLPKAKELIRQFRGELSELLEQGGTDEVYRLNIQLFPLTRRSRVGTTDEQ